MCMAPRTRSMLRGPLLELMSPGCRPSEQVLPGASPPHTTERRFVVQCPLCPCEESQGRLHNVSQMLTGPLGTPSHTHSHLPSPSPHASGRKLQGEGGCGGLLLPPYPPPAPGSLDLGWGRGRGRGGDRSGGVLRGWKVRLDQSCHELAWEFSIRAGQGPFWNSLDNSQRREIFSMVLMISGECSSLKFFLQP